MEMTMNQMYAQMENALAKEIAEEQMRIYFEGLQALDEMEIYEQYADILNEYDSIMESNYGRKAKGESRYATKKVEKSKRKAKATLQVAEEMRVCNIYGVCDNGHYFIAPTNCRGAYTITLIEKKANRKRKRTVADDIAEYLADKEAEYKESLIAEIVEYYDGKADDFRALNVCSIDKLEKIVDIIKEV